MTQLHFTFGPVQEFVSEARKTVDLRCGSYLISYLAAHAINGALEVGAREEDFFPRIVGNPLLEAVRGSEHSSGSPGSDASVGSLPNRFSVLADSEGEGRRFARAAEDGLKSAWKAAAGACWKHLTERHAPLKNRAGVWDRQVANLWETGWVISADPRALARRKDMRAFPPSEEPGRKCTVCGRREELGNTGFFRAFSEKFGSGFLNADKERLCAVCLVKRTLTLPRVGEEAFGWKALSGTFPSTPDIAADSWQREVIQNERHEEARNRFSRAVNEPFESAPGTYFFPAYREDFPQEQTTKLNSALPALVREVGSAPRPTYAILAMDGDSMGARLSKLDGDGRAELSERILDFSLRVRRVVEDGEDRSRLVYAGGEDVLALLPMDRALGAAWRVRELYAGIFEEFDESHREELGDASTISAGLLFCPMTLPLRTATREAHRLLDEDAKEDAGRDALAVGVWKGGGETLKVARKWECRSWVEKLIGMTAERESPYPSRFLYQAREITGGAAKDLDAETVGKLLALEYLGSREERFHTKNMDEAENRIAPLVEMSRTGGNSLDPSFFRLVRFFYEERA